MVKPASLTRRRTTPARRPAAPPAIDRDTEQRILDAAHAVFMRRGTAGARMQEIADEAGVNKALLHYYFRSKAASPTRSSSRVACGLFARLGTIRGGPTPTSRTKVRRIIAIYLDQLRAHAVRARLRHQRDQPASRTRRSSCSRPSADCARKRHPAILPRDARAPDRRRASRRDACARSRRASSSPTSRRSASSRSPRGRCSAPSSGSTTAGFQRFIEERKTTLPDFFLNALRP